MRYRDGRPAGVERVLVSAQHAADVAVEELRPAIRGHVVAPVVAAHGFDGDLGPRLPVNPTGRFAAGGPAVDRGLTGPQGHHRHLRRHGPRRRRRILGQGPDEG